MPQPELTNSIIFHLLTKAFTPQLSRETENALQALYDEVKNQAPERITTDDLINHVRQKSASEPIELHHEIQQRWSCICAIGKTQSTDSPDIAFPVLIDRLAYNEYTAEDPISNGPDNESPEENEYTASNEDPISNGPDNESPEEKAKHNAEVVSDYILNLIRSKIPGVANYIAIGIPKDPPTPAQIMLLAHALSHQQNLITALEKELGTFLSQVNTIISSSFSLLLHVLSLSIHSTYQEKLNTYIDSGNHNYTNAETFYTTSLRSLLTTISQDLLTSTEHGSTTISKSIVIELSDMIRATPAQVLFDCTDKQQSIFNLTQKLPASLHFIPAIYGLITHDRRAKDQFRYIIKHTSVIIKKYFPNPESLKTENFDTLLRKILRKIAKDPQKSFSPSAMTSFTAWVEQNQLGETIVDDLQEDLGQIGTARVEQNQLGKTIVDDLQKGLGQIGNEQLAQELGEQNIRQMPESTLAEMLALFSPKAKAKLLMTTSFTHIDKDNETGRWLREKLSTSAQQELKASIATRGKEKKPSISSTTKKEILECLHPAFEKMSWANHISLAITLLGEETTMNILDRAKNTLFELFYNKVYRECHMPTYLKTANGINAHVKHIENQFGPLHKIIPGTPLSWKEAFLIAHSVAKLDSPEILNTIIEQLLACIQHKQDDQGKIVVSFSVNTTMVSALVECLTKSMSNLHNDAYVNPALYTDLKKKFGHQVVEHLQGSPIKEKDASRNNGVTEKQTNTSRSRWAIFLGILYQLSGMQRIQRLFSFNVTQSSEKSTTTTEKLLAHIPSPLIITLSCKWLQTLCSGLFLSWTLLNLPRVKRPFHNLWQHLSTFIKNVVSLCAFCLWNFRLLLSYVVINVYLLTQISCEKMGILATGAIGASIVLLAKAMFSTSSFLLKAVIGAPFWPLTLAIAGIIITNIVWHVFFAHKLNNMLQSIMPTQKTMMCQSQADNSPHMHEQAHAFDRGIHARETNSEDLRTAPQEALFATDFNAKCDVFSLNLEFTWAIDAQATTPLNGTITR